MVAGESLLDVSEGFGIQVGCNALLDPRAVGRKAFRCVSRILRDVQRSSPFSHVGAKARAPCRGGPEAEMSCQRPV